MGTWKPTNQPDRYDEARVATLEPVRQAVMALGLPLTRLRKINGILGALEMQIEDGGDSPTVNEHLLAALRACVLHQVDTSQAAPVLAAIDAFAEQEARRWQQVQAGALPPIEVPPAEQMEDLVGEGYDLLAEHQNAAGCDRLLAAWDIAKTLITPEMHSTRDFEAVYPPAMYDFREWCVELAWALLNPALNDPRYAQKRLTFVQEFLHRFPEEDTDTQVDFLRSWAESLWAMGRRSDADAVYAQAIEKFPDQAWLYIGWSYHYWASRKEPGDPQRAEAILRRALKRPRLDDRESLLQVLERLHKDVAGSQSAPPAAQEGGRKPSSLFQQVRSGVFSLVNRQESGPAPAQKQLKRNDPCWCGSGKKYKHCHMKADRAG